MNSNRPTQRSSGNVKSRQRGVVLLFSLIALVIMLVAAVALVRSFHSTLFAAGNIGFKRDMRNQGEMAVSKALGYFRGSSSLSTSALRAADKPLVNYSATMLPSTNNKQSIPDALVLSDSDFASSYQGADLVSADNSVTIRYVIDRLCSSNGDETSLGTVGCVVATNPTPAGTGALGILGADRAPLCPTCASAAPLGVVYRLSIKVSGPRNTQSFFQSTFTVPS